MINFSISLTAELNCGGSMHNYNLQERLSFVLHARVFFYKQSLPCVNILMKNIDLDNMSYLL